jgi:hypothetical protein
LIILAFFKVEKIFSKYPKEIFSFFAITAKDKLSLFWFLAKFIIALKPYVARVENFIVSISPPCEGGAGGGLMIGANTRETSPHSSPY